MLTLNDWCVGCIASKQGLLKWVGMQRKFFLFMYN
jgi:hypothetical protein